MRGFLPLVFTLIISLAGAGPGAGVARAQGHAKTLTLYYDSARTQRRAVYQARLSGPRPDTVAHGPFRRFWRGGSLIELGHFTEGLADSVWTRYYPAPKGGAPAVARRLPMRAGQPDGPFVVFHPSGGVAQRGTFRQGQLVDSLVSRTAGGQPRLLARFAGRGAGLAGEFRQWYSGVTAQPLVSGDDLFTSYDVSSYPLADPGRYWTGRLSAGKLVGSFTEYDPDGQRRVQLMFDSVGRLQVLTRYYPAAWRRYAFLAIDDSMAALRACSIPYLQLRAVGPGYLLQRTWEWDSDSTLGSSRLWQTVGSPRHPKGARCAAEPGPQLKRADAGALMGVLSQTTSFYSWVPKRPLPPARPVPRPSPVHTVPSFGIITGLLPAPFDQQYWRIGETDTLTGAYRLLPRRELRFSSGKLAGIETAHGTQYFSETGTLWKKFRVTKDGTLITHSYLGNGQLQSVVWRNEAKQKAFSRARNRKNGRMPMLRRRISMSPIYR